MDIEFDNEWETTSDWNGDDDEAIGWKVRYSTLELKYLLATPMYNGLDLFYLV